MAGVSRRSLFGLMAAPLLVLLPREEKYVTYVSSIDYIDKVVTLKTVTEREYAALPPIRDYGDGALNYRADKHNLRGRPEAEWARWRRKYGSR